MFGRTSAGVGDPEVTDADRRIADVVKYGTVVEADYLKGLYRVGIGDPADEDGYLVTGWLKGGARRAAAGEVEYDPPEVGERVMLHSESGELQNAIVGHALFAEGQVPDGAKAGLYLRTFKGGASIRRDRDTGVMTVDGGDTGSLTLQAGGCSITLQGGKITLKGEMIVTDGETHLNNGTRGVVFSGSKDTHGDVNSEGASGVFV